MVSFSEIISYNFFFLFDLYARRKNRRITVLIFRRKIRILDIYTIIINVTEFKMNRKRVLFYVRIFFFPNTESDEYRKYFNIIYRSCSQYPFQKLMILRIIFRTLHLFCFFFFSSYSFILGIRYFYLISTNTKFDLSDSKKKKMRLNKK